MTVVEAPVLVDACFAIKCDKCGKTTWRGCGRHVESVMKDVKEEDKCVCREISERQDNQKQA